ncbi:MULTISPECIES: phasin [Chelativorans]|uniref:phasin n=1 Tax=Chelativorans TaxID=449972 RepID=UPI0013592299|nr:MULTISPECIES: phasin [Chelativorans]
MSKTSNKPEGTEFPTFDASKATEQFRSFAEKSAEQTRETYEKMKSGAEDARKAFEASFENAKSVGDELVLKSIAAMRVGAEANFAQFEALVGASSFSEVIELQSSFLRKQMELAADQAKEFQAISQKAATEVTKPVKDAFEKALKQAAA